MGQGMGFVDGTGAADFGAGALLTLASVRMWASSQSMCCSLIQVTERLLEDDAHAALVDLTALAWMLDVKSRRAVELARPNDPRVTADELSLVALIAAAQAGDLATRDACLAWLFAGRPPEAAALAVDRLGAILGKHGYRVRAPELTISPAA